MRADLETAEGRATIPVVDFAEFAATDPARRAATAARLRAALEAYGFLYLLNHGVPTAVLDAAFAASRAFFALPQDAKEAAASREPGNTLGYGRLGGQALDEARPPDLKEIFQAGPEREGARANIWPDGLPAFRAAVRAFHTAAAAACDQLMRAMALSLGLAEDFFDRYYDRRDATARLLHYPPLSGPPAPGQLRAGAHTDFGGMNLLFQDDEGGLEIQAPDGTWVPAPALPGAAIVNTGDLIERWTNGQFRSSPHRVVNPTGDGAARDRYSMVLFDIPNRDAVISCLEPCQSPERPPRYPPITAGDHLRARIQASRRQSY
ncbi:MAG TPA: 2-oxoglutarate and iron-dependent oxygenase domain-containing protein [Chloroflexota bacterium]|nr:2-oxoglutarate and iron-dependent oxygenase domain-containing protein [Chloroflexota bacterium]